MPGTSESIYEVLDKLYAAGNTARVEEFLMQALLENQPFCGQINSAFITVLFELGVYFRREGKLSRSLDWFLLLRSFIRDHLGAASFEHAVIMENMAAVYELSGEYDKALHYYLQALKIYKKTRGVHNRKYAELLVIISSIYEAQKDYRAALIFHENLLSIRPGRKEPGGYLYFSNLVESYGNPHPSRRSKCSQ